MLTKLAFSNFRCFKDSQTLDLKPVTVVLGKNNSGKSAFTRAPMVFGTGFSEGSTTLQRAPLDLDRLGPDSVGSFTDLVYRHSPHGRISVEFEFDDRLVRSATAQIQNIDGERLQIVSRFEVVLKEGTLSLEWTQEKNFYRQRWLGADGQDHVLLGPVRFDGLAPQKFPEFVHRSYPTAAVQLAQACASAFGRIGYLSPFRDRPKREHYLPVGEPVSLGDGGQHLSAVLANDEVRGEGRVRRRINELLQEVLPDWQLDEVPDGRLYATVLRSRRDSHLSVNVADAGSGVTQILPILAQQAIDELTAGRSSGLQIVEEPELHLHPAAHAQLADLYLRAAKKTGKRFLIETHSEALLLRLRRRIAENLVTPADVGIYFVHHDGRAAHAEEIAVDEAGRLSSWPDGVFTEDFDEVRALTAAQLRRAHADAA
ncbi:DUF3696 domain-containing protein [Catellatospora sp. KI3]|uniref:AAA family ATPase n=1 Tax=Catellatospora sp. KI3 TaxID=3041620 RepID=UPI0024821C9A|nr:DUF3696 domain-containing protein [Catellatospora sp. KI3]MDI1463352.1 DUF3696 domain-containing protein [Catellatospora sp. KI3]